MSHIPTVLIVPGLRDRVEQHWQTLLASELASVRVVPAMGREDLDLARRVKALEQEAQAIDGPVVIVAHSAGTITVAQWAMARTRRIAGALLVTPPDFEQPMPAGYPSVEELRDAGWLPVPREPLPFRSIVAASRNDPLASYDHVEQLARDWDSQLVDLGPVGHMNPASGFGPWPRAHDLIEQLADLPLLAQIFAWAQPLRY